MNKIYTFSTKDFKPISFNDFYLYENYGLIIQLLKANKINPNDIDRLCMPEIKGGIQVDWYANKKGEFKSLDKFDNKIQASIMSEFNDWKSKLTGFSKKLKNNSSPESKEWHLILEAILNKDNLVLLSNGEDWALVWGWIFNAFNLYYSAPEFERYQNTPELIHEEQPIQTLGDVNLKIKDEEIVQDPPIVEPERVVERQVYPRYKVSWWRRVLRFLRWFTYRFWFFFLLIVFCMLLICLFRWFNIMYCI